MGILDGLTDERLAALKRKRFGLYRGIVRDVDDPDGLGRVRLEVPELLGPDVLTDWASYCSPFGGNGAGWWGVPDVGDAAWVAFERGDPDRPVWIGYWFSEADPRPEPAGKQVRVLRSKSGHRIVLDDENGKVRIEDSDGQYVEWNTDSGRITVDAKEKILLGEGATTGAARLNDETKSTATEDSHFWAVVNAIAGVINTVPPIVEAGNGAPSALQAAFKAALAAAGGAPSSLTGKITSASDKVEAE